MTMDSKRAKEICESTHMVNVTHNGVPIYIDSVSEDRDTASIHPLNQPNEQQTVSVSSLAEISK
jgi:small acid-soluble spore protein H (minor)